MTKKIAILGAGESGTGAAVLAIKQGFRVWLSDSGTIKEKYKNVLSHHEIAFEESKHTEDQILDTEVSSAEVSRRNLQVRIYTTTSQPGNTSANAYCFENKIHINTNNNHFTMTLEELALQGKHNVYNSMAASIGASLLDIRKESIRQSLSAFENVPHRLEYVARIHGIDFINDSKATNVNSAWYALETMDSPVIWIAGGVDKGNDYTKLDELVANKVKAIICLGSDNSKIISRYADKVQAIYETQSAEQAVLTAYTIGKKGDTVLLSPACASYDLFESFEERGDKFRQAVKNL